MCYKFFGDHTFQDVNSATSIIYIKTRNLIYYYFFNTLWYRVS